LDSALIALNAQNGLPDRMLVWIRAGGLASGPGPMERRGRIIVGIKQTMNADRQQGYFATVLCKSDERETAPVAFFSMHSPTLDVPMRVEVPLRALMLGNPPLAGGYICPCVDDQPRRDLCLLRHHKAGLEHPLQRAHAGRRRPEVEAAAGAQAR
jgi:hypothetical protein